TLISAVIVFSVFVESAVLAMIVQLIRKIRVGTLNASSATKKYQKTAVYSLVMQGAIPGIFYLVPSVGLFSIHLYSFIAGLEKAATNQAASTISVLLVNIVSLHGLANSLTILACTPSLRRNISKMIRRPESIVLVVGTQA
ncbi:hypothetical protein PMAYCL1PPCAC_32124, partial [Pristionchus mayeri]